MRAKSRLTGRAGIVAAVLLTCVTAAAGTALGSARERVDRILEMSGVRGGVIVHVGGDDGKLTAALRAGNCYVVQGLDQDPADVRSARDHIREKDVYGPVSVSQWDGERLPYTDNLVNLVVSEKPLPVPVDEVMRVLRPGGVACVRQGGKWTRKVKPWPDEIDDWTHFLHGPDNNAVAHDTVVGPPHHVQWLGTPKWCRSHDHLASVSAVVSARGRLFYIVDRGTTATVASPPEWMLVARDAFNGVVLWERPMGQWEDHLRGFRSGPSWLARRLVAVGDRVYATLGYGEPVSILDATTGERLRTCEGTENAREIICKDDTLYVVLSEEQPGDEESSLADARKVDHWLYWDVLERELPKTRIVAVDADTGRKKWERSARDAAHVMPTTLAVADGRVYYQNMESIMCLNADTGRKVWSTQRPMTRKRHEWSAPTLVMQEGVVLSADRLSTFPKNEEVGDIEKVRWIISNDSSHAGKRGKLMAFAGDSGQKLWERDCYEGFTAPVDVLVVNGMVWSGKLAWGREPGITRALDLHTGEIVKERPKDQKQFDPGFVHHRCYRNKATDRYLVLGRAGIEFIDVATGEGIADHWVRGACQYGVMPCNGLVYAPPHSCACYVKSKLNSFNALAPRREGEKVGKKPAEGRLERGSAYDESLAPPTERDDDWPTYRADGARSGVTDMPVTADLKTGWKTKLGGRLTSPVVGRERVFVAEVDAHTVHALNSGTGGTIWSYTAGGRIDSPPSVYRGRVLFGSADGGVYCLTAADGELAWRFRAGPDEMRVMSYGQLESAWPVPGSVLVKDDRVYFVAGRSSFLDGGMFLYRLDVRTGKKISRTRLYGRDPQTGREPQKHIRGVNTTGGIGALPDILSSDGDSIYLRHRRFNLKGEPLPANVPHLYSPAGFLDDSWWHRTYWQFGTHMGTGYGGWFKTGQKVPAGRLLLTDDEVVYGYGRSEFAKSGSHLGLRGVHNRLFAVRKPGGKAGGGEEKRRSAAVQDDPGWSEKVPVLVRAMLKAGQKLFIAGPPNGRDVRHLAAGLNGKKGGDLWVVDSVDGGKLAAYELESPPVFDGMAAAGGRLYISSIDGSLLCMEPK